MKHHETGFISRSHFLFVEKLAGFQAPVVRRTIFSAFHPTMMRFSSS
jgi:hypothetical protein